MRHFGNRTLGVFYGIYAMLYGLYKVTYRHSQKYFCCLVRNVKLAPLKEVYNCVLSGTLQDGKTQLAILKYVAIKKGGKI